MSYQRNYDRDEQYLRIKYKKAREKKFRRRRIIVAVLAWFIAVPLTALVLFGIYKLGSAIAEEFFTDREYYDVQPDERTISLVENYLIKPSDEVGDFYEDIQLIHHEVVADSIDPEAFKYAGIEKGSKGLVIVDAGHGGYDGGAVANGLVEKEINLSIAYWLKDELELRGYSVYMTRTNDDFVALTERASLANSQDSPKCLVSVHLNSVDESSQVKGIEAWTYDRDRCTELGDIICETVSKRTEAQNRGTHYRTNLVVTSKTTMPAVIVECGYITNPDEAAKLSTDDYQIMVAKGIADGVDKFNGY